MLCYRCGSHAPDASQVCPACGQALVASGALSAASGPKRGSEGAPYRPGDGVAGRFTVEQVLGSGPLGWVFRAQDTKLGVEVALKSLHPHLVQAAEEREHFRKVMRLARRVSHAHLLRVYDEGEDAGRPFFTAQYVEGKSLRALLDERRGRAQPFTLAEAEPLLVQMAQALEAIHRALPHGDFKPENVLLVPDVLKLTDVGLGGAMPTLPFVQAQRQARRDHYFAPEASEAAEDEGLESTADVYSLGVVMGEMLTGRTPDDGALPELSQLVPSLPPAIDGIYRRALSINPLARYRSATDMVAEVTALLGQAAPAGAEAAREAPADSAKAVPKVAARSATPPPPAAGLKDGRTATPPPPAAAAAPARSQLPSPVAPPAVVLAKGAAPVPPAPTLNDAPTQAMETPAWLLPGASLDAGGAPAKSARGSRAAAPAVDAGAATILSMPAVKLPAAPASPSTVTVSPSLAAPAPKLMVSGGSGAVGNQRVIATEMLQVDAASLPELPTEEPRRTGSKARPPVRTDPGVRTPTFPQLVPPPGVAAPRSPPPPRKSKKRSELWLLVLAVIGVGLGVGAGTLLLRALRPTPTTAPLPTAQPASVPSSGGPSK